MYPWSFRNLFLTHTSMIFCSCSAIAAIKKSYIGRNKLLDLTMAHILLYSQQFDDLIHTTFVPYSILISITVLWYQFCCQCWPCSDKMLYPKSDEHVLSHFAAVSSSWCRCQSGIWHNWWCYYSRHSLPSGPIYAHMPLVLKDCLHLDINLTKPSLIALQLNTIVSPDSDLTPLYHA